MYEEEKKEDIVISAEEVNSAIVKGFSSAAKNIVRRDVDVYPVNKDSISPELKQVYDFKVIEKETATNTQKNIKSVAVISSSLAAWYINSGIIKVAVTTTASIGAGFVMSSIFAVYCGAKSVGSYMNEDYEDSIKFSLYGGVILTSTATTLFPLWQASQRTSKDLVKYNQEKRSFEQYIEGYKKPLSLNSFSGLVLVLLFLTIIIMSKISFSKK